MGPRITGTLLGASASFCVLGMLLRYDVLRRNEAFSEMMLSAPQSTLTFTRAAPSLATPLVAGVQRAPLVDVREGGNCVAATVSSLLDRLARLESSIDKL